MGKMDNRIAEMQELIEKSKKIVEEQRKDFVDGKTLSSRRYFKTEKGKEVSRRGWRLRSERMQEAMRETSKEERKTIREFYYNTPQGYEVDHIVPLCRGGLHVLSNLRYCTHEENARKANKLLEEIKIDISLFET